MHRAILATKGLVLLATACLAMPVGLWAQTVTLVGATNNQVLTNGQKLRLTIAVANAFGDHNILSIYDGNKFLFGRPFSPASAGPNFSLTFEWIDPPLGQHALQGVWLELDPITGNPIATNRSAVINLRVVGRTFGFSGITNFFTNPSPERTGVDTQFGCRLELRNQTATLSNPLRVRLLSTQTYYYYTNEFNPAPPTGSIPFVEMTNSAALASNFTVAPNASFFLAVPSNSVCPQKFIYTNPQTFEEAHVQYHIYAILEERIGNAWSIVDSAQLDFSILDTLSSNYDLPGASVVGLNSPASLNRIAHPTTLTISGPTTLIAGDVTSYAAIATFSDQATGAIIPTWSSSSSLLTIDANGEATAGNTTSNLTVTLTATYVRNAQVRATTQVTLVPAPTVSLTGVTNNQVLVNGQKVQLTAGVANAAQAGEYSLSIYDGNKFLFGRPLTPDAATNYTMVWEWPDPPLGSHALQAVLIGNPFANPISTNRSAVVNIRVAGRAFGFASVTNLFTSPSPEQWNVDTRFGCQLEVRNQTGARSNPLRARLLQTETYYYVTNDSHTPPALNSIPFSEVTNSTALASNFTVAANASFFVSVPSNNICPATYTNVNDQGQEGFVQSHSYAILEERIGSNTWSIIDSAQIVFSILTLYFPYNDGAIGMNPISSTNRIAYPTNLVIAGPTNLNEGTVTSYVAVATLSDNASGTVIPTWSSSSALLSIDANGVATVGHTTSDTQVALLASYTRSYVTETVTQQVTVIDLGEPPTITSPPQSQLVALGSNATFSVLAAGTAPLAYQWRFAGTPIPGASAASYTVFRAQPGQAGTYTVTITNRAGNVTSDPATLTVVDRPVLRAGYLPTNGAVELTLTGSPAHSCAIEISTNLTDWTTLTNLANPTGLTLFSDRVLTQSRRFYRARVLN